MKRTNFSFLSALSKLFYLLAGIQITAIVAGTLLLVILFIAPRGSVSSGVGYYIALGISIATGVYVAYNIIKEIDSIDLSALIKK